MSKEFSYSDVAAHKSENDCWIVIHGKVYDVTEFLDKHPGGADIIMDDAGADVTTQFEDTGHSDDARKDMLKYEVGVIKAGEQKVGKTKGKSGAANANGGESAQAMNPGIVVAGVVLIMAVLFVLLNPT
jgi:cytochrome-b5 reductase